jgi:hypothetical protein
MEGNQFPIPSIIIFAVINILLYLNATILEFVKTRELLTHDKCSVLVLKAYPGPPIFHFILGYPDKKHRG